MKLKKRQPIFRILSLAVLFCLLFTACTPASDPEGLFGTPSSEPEVIREGSWDYDLSEVPYNYVNAYIGADFCDYGEKVLFVANSNPYMLYTYDKRTGKIETFCKDAVCNHNTPSCPAFEITALDLYQGKIYGLRLLGLENDGVHHHELTELKNGRFEAVLSPVSYARFHQGHLYVRSLDGTLLKYPEGDFKDPVILKEDLSNYGRHVYVGGYFYFSKNDAIHRFNLNDPDTVETVAEDLGGIFGEYVFRTDGEYLYYCNKDYYLMRCNLDGSDPILLTQMPVRASTVNFDEEHLYFTGYDPTDRTAAANNQLYRIKRNLSSQTEPELVADLGFPLYCVCTIYQLDALFLWPLNTVNNNFYIINKDGTGLQKLVLPE